MYDNYNYPPGADTPDAPWNQVENPEKEFDVTISQTLSKTVTIVTTNYNYYEDVDEDGSYVNYDTSDTNWNKEYSESYHTPLELIGILKKVLQGEELSQRLKNRLIEECDDWCDDETEFTEE